MIKQYLVPFIQRPFIAWLWTISIIIACNWPAKNIPQASLPGMDKVVHITFFFIWTVLWLTTRRMSTVKALWVGTLLGLAIEVAQWLLPFNRSFDLLDLVADTTGVILGILLYQTVLRNYLQRLY